MDQIKKNAAYAAIEAVRDAQSAYEGHGRTSCQRCMWHQPCNPRADLQRRVYMASQTARAALLDYAPTGSTVEYHGPAVHLHGVWSIGDTCRKSLHATFLLIKPGTGAIIEDVAVSDVRRPIEAEPTGVLAAVRTAAAEITRLLATCGQLLHVRVTAEHGKVSITYDAPMFARYETQATYTRAHATGRAQQEASYCVAALRSLRRMAELADSGALDEIYGVARASEAARSRLAAIPTRRPRA
ncbi:hypothetical protein SAMN05421874_12856 [Nonomuraea maritima]|uniref:Uncharacterized protein n=1 Tax=Nonomuraea maritima TaxID=683260 RepID=A0A1G9MIL5_9ACTN|nr:hypothetical protein [Nonomuraea maritima]SDL74108.1 hypothetical protein SAMN05421874_12856 [Nonomuraea maritima]